MNNINSLMKYSLGFIAILLMIVNVCMGSESIQANELKQDQQIILTVHNQFRKLHHAPSLIWDDELAQYAKRHANMCRFKHSGSPYGENLAAGYPSLAAAINAWYAENALYSYNRPGFSYSTGHFTQLVWMGTQKIGCAYVACNGSGGTPGNYLVCEYSPAGNIANRGYFARNVLPVS